MANDIYTEFLIDGVWTDYSSRVRGEQGVIISRGIADQASSLSPQTSSFTLNNRDGLFSNRNPSSPLYRKIPQNTPVRHRVGAQNSYLKLRHPSGSGYAETPSSASIAITGDTDVRIELTPDTWRPPLDVALAGRYILPTNQRSWALRLTTTGQPIFQWTTDGMFATVQMISPGGGAVIPKTSGRLAIRVTIDVVDGANRTITFYTAPRINGTWTMLGTAVTLVGNTSIFAGTAAIEVGAANNGALITNGGSTVAGNVHAFELRNGIGGPVVASLAVQGVSPSTTSWADPQGNTWTVFSGGNARVSSDVYRFAGEVTSLPSVWDVTGRDVLVPTSAAGVLRRLSQRSSPLHSSIYRNFIQYASGITMYAPMEEASGSTTLTNISTLPAKVSNTIQDVTFSGTSPIGLPGSSGSLTLNSSPTSKVIMRASSLANTGIQSFLIYFKMDSLPATNIKLITVTGSGTGVTWAIGVDSIAFNFNIYDRDGAVLGSASVLYGTGANPIGQWLGISLSGVQEGANVRWRTDWHAVGTNFFWTDAPGGSTYVGTVGRFTTMTLSSSDPAFVGAEFAHAIMAQRLLNYGTDEFAMASNAYIGEAAGARAKRLSGQEGVLIDMYGEPSASELMGPQNADTLSNLLEECVSADMGMMAELRDVPGFAYYTRQFLENGTPLPIVYTQSILSEPPNPVEDDRYILNDVTAVRPIGGYARSEVSSGPLSVLPPPNGVGRYEGTVPVNVATDDQLPDQASYRSFVGSWDEARVPTLTVGMHRTQITGNATMTDSLNALDVGGWTSLRNLPSFMPPDNLDLIVLGTDEELYKFTRTIRFNTIPAGPYRIPILDDPDNPVRADAENSTLDVAITTTSATSIQVTNNGDASDTWIPTSAYPTEVPFNIVINGEVMTVTNVGDIFSTTKQTLTVTRSVNGVAKTHLVNSKVRLERPYYATL